MFSSYIPATDPAANPSPGLCPRDEPEARTAGETLGRLH